MATKKQKFVIPAPLAARKRKATIVEEAIDTINRKYKIDRAIRQSFGAGCRTMPGGVWIRS